MSDSERDDLVSRALGEADGSPDLDERLAGDPAAREELDELRRVVELARGLGAGDRELEAPPERVWDRIAAEVAEDSEGAGTEEAQTADPAEHARTGGARRAGGGSGEVTSLDGHRARRLRVALATAAALVAVAVIGAVTVGNLGAPEPDPVATASLDALDDRANPAQARLVADDDELVLRVDPGELPSADGYYEVWLIDENVEGMVSLGPLDTARGQRIPAGLDPEDFPVVDVSLEPLDGDPTHSGDSLLRGQLEL